MRSSVKLAVERLTALGRVILAAGLLLTALLLPAVDFPAYWLLVFTFSIYLAYALVVLVWLHRQPEMRWASRALLGDVVVLGMALVAARFMPLGTLYFVLFLSAVAGLRRGWLTSLALSVGMSIAFLLATLRTAVWQDSERWWSYLPEERLAVLVGLVAGGSLVGYLAQRERRYLERRSEAESVAALLRLDAPWTDVWRRWQAELCRRFQARRCLLAHRDAETDRVILWQFTSGEENDDFQEEERPPRDAATFLVGADDYASFFLSRTPGTSALARRQLSEEPTAVPPLPARFLEEFQAHAVLSVALPPVEGSTSRLWLLDARAGSFTREQFDELQQLLGSLTPILSNLLTVRRLIARATDAERERIARDLHDGVAQTVAGLDMRVSALLRKAPDNAVAEELARLRDILRAEKERLRAYVRTLKPIHIPPAELVNWVVAHCTQWQQETGVAVDLLLNPVGPSLPEGICREVFLIVREALHNVHKHAGATHVLVKLRQDDDFLRLLVDDDGHGFPFTGTYSQHALEEQGLGPASICERARALGATLTIDSTPGSGSTLRVDIPLR